MADQFVYFAEAMNGLLKIGVAADVAKRMRGLRAMSLIPLYLFHVVSCQGENHRDVEAAFHRRFAGQRHHGEWFHLRREQRQEILGMEEAILSGLKRELIPCPRCLKYVKGKRGLSSHRQFCGMPGHRRHRRR